MKNTVIKGILLINLMTICLTSSLGANKTKSIPATDSKQQWIYDGIEFEMPVVAEPVIPDYHVSITMFGAVGDGETNNSDAFAKAIEHVSKKGGGRVIVPRGIFVTGPIVMKSNIDLHVSDGAVVLFSKNLDDYPLVENSFEGLNTYRCMSPIHAHNLENIAFTGNGVFDGSGEVWRPVKIAKMTAGQWQKLINSGGVLSDDKKTWFPTLQSKAGSDKGQHNVPSLMKIEDYENIKDFLRPVMVSIKNSKRILLDGPTFQNSPAWNIHPLMCEDVTIRNLTVRNPWYSQNGDGLDLESCRNVVIYNNSFDVGDDAICIKSGKDKDGRLRGMPTENVIIKNNIVYHGHGGFVIGSEMSGDVRNVHVSDCTFMGTNVGLRFKSTRGRGGVVENIYISNIDMIDIPNEPIHFNLFYGGKIPVIKDGELSNLSDETEMVTVTEETPAFRNIFMKNINANGFGNAAFFMGLPEMNLQNVHLENATLRATDGISIIDANGIVLINVTVKSDKGPALVLFNGKNITVSNFDYTISQTIAIGVYGDSTEKIDLQLKRKNTNNAALEIGKDVSKSELQVQ